MFWLIFPIATIICYFADFTTLFYICGGISFFVDVMNFLRGDMFPAAVSIQIILTIIVWIASGSFVVGLLLGSAIFGVLSILYALMN